MGTESIRRWRYIGLLFHQLQHSAKNLRSVPTRKPAGEDANVFVQGYPAQHSAAAYVNSCDQLNIVTND